MKDLDPFFLNEKDNSELKTLKSQKRRRNAFYTLIVLQAGAVALAYILGRSHK